MLFLAVVAVALLTVRLAGGRYGRLAELPLRAYAERQDPVLVG